MKEALADQAPNPNNSNPNLDPMQTLTTCRSCYSRAAYRARYHGALAARVLQLYIDSHFNKSPTW